MTVAGNREYGHADDITALYKSSSDSEAGDAVYVSGHDGSHIQVKLSGDSNNKVHGIIEDSVAQDEYSNVHFDGAVWARVDDDDDVSAGDTVGVDGTPANGELTSSASSYVVLEGETDIGGTKYALVHLSANPD